MEFYKHHIDSLVKQFNSNIQNGLDENGIRSARQKFGKNILKAANTRSIYQILLGQFTSPLVLILLVASLASFYLQQRQVKMIYSGLRLHWNKNQNILLQRGSCRKQRPY